MNQVEFDFSTHPVVDAARMAGVAFSSFAATPAARRTDRDTAKLAASRNASGRGTDRINALRILARHPAGLTDHELGERMGRIQTSAGKRRGELTAAGLVEATTERRLSPSGSPCTVWKITEAGKQATRGNV